MNSIWRIINILKLKGFVILHGPKELPQQLGSHLIVKKKMDPNHVWSLRCVLKATEDKSLFLFRIFDPSAAAGAKIKITDYDSLNKRPELILYHADYRKHFNNANFHEDVEHAA